ncbi:hypothetical protein ABZ557_11470 [Streptomyces sp. NPDC019645]|uniref:hypothetical protein n=1 Tax=Streptomyces sp. NPDC019645 TaxID=3154786 RepID=UPI0033C034EA
MSRGFAWAGRDYGPACMSVTGIDAVTAEGERVHADESRNTDLLWAARGAGPGFFAVVTRFHVKLYPRKRITMNSGYFWPASAARDVYGFVHEIGRQTPAEINLMCNRDPLTNDEPLISLTPPPSPAPKRRPGSNCRSSNTFRHALSCHAQGRDGALASVSP